jgi:uncharacterized protein YbjT (DUF2867 family)
MRVLIFGATGMVGQGVLRASLEAPDVLGVTTVGRTPVEQQHRKLAQIVQADLMDLASRANELGGFDACFFCLGVSVSGLSESEYHQLTYVENLFSSKIFKPSTPKTNQQTPAPSHLAVYRWERSPTNPSASAATLLAP